MSLNKKLLVLAIASAFSGASHAVVDLNTAANGVTPAFASEVTVPVGGVSISNAPTELDVRVTAGFGVSPLAIRFIRFDFPGTTLATALVGSGAGAGTGDFTLTDSANAAGAAYITAPTAPSFTVVSGGNVGDNNVIVQVTAGTGNGILPTDRFVFHPALTNGGVAKNAVKATTKDTQTIKYALYEFGGNANTQVTPLSGPVTGNWYTWTSGVTASCAASTANANRIDATNAKNFLGTSTTYSDIFDLTITPKAGVYIPSSGAVPMTLAAYMGPNTTIKTTGSFKGALSLTTLAGSTFTVDATKTFSTWAFAAAPVGFTATSIRATTTAAEAMVASNYDVLITPTAGTDATVNPINLNTCGTLKFSGSSDRVDFVVTPGTGNKQLFRVTNPTGTSGPVNFTVWNDAGAKVDFPLSAVKVGPAPGVALPLVLNAQASTPLITTEAIYAAAQAASAAFNVGTNADGVAGRLRIEARGDFGDDALDGNFTKGGKPLAARLKDGIYIQAVTTSALYQSH